MTLGDLNNGVDGVVHRKIRILFLIDELQVGGTERQLIFLAESLPRDRFEPVIGVLRETEFSRGLRIKTPIVNFNWSGFPLLKNISLIGKLKNYLKNNNIDMLQTQFIESEIYGFLAAILSAERPVLIATRRNLYHWINDDPLRFQIGKRLVRFAQAVLANSYCARDACVRLENVPAEKITVIPNGVDVESFKSRSRQDARGKYGIGQDDLIIGVVGNLRHVKGVDVLLRASARVLEVIPAARFMLVGSGPQESELRNLALELGIGDKVVFWGATDDVQNLVAVFDIAVQPSRSESFSNVLVEYMAAAKPIVATRVGDAGLILDGGLCGKLVQSENHDELAKEIISLCQDMDYATSMAQRAKTRVLQMWTTAIVISHYVEFYESYQSAKSGQGIHEQ